MKVDFDVSGWDKARTYEKFDVVFFSGDPETGCNQFESGYYYATASSNATTNSTLSPTGVNAKWTRSFPSTPSYNSSVSFEAKTFKNVFGDGYYSIVPKSHNNLAIQYDLNFNGRTEKESKAILHFLGHRFEEAYTGAASGIVGALPGNATRYQSEEVLTGFNFTPFAPYDQTGKYFCESFDHQEVFPNVHNVNASFNNEETSLTNWMNQVIPLDNTAKYWAAGQTYNKFDVAYYSGHNISNHSGYYYNSGDSDEVTATTANGPEGANTLWTKDVFYFKPSSFSAPQEPRILKNEFNRDYVKRWNDGINTNLLNINLNFEGKSETESKAITHFLINKKGYESFKFSPPKPYNQNNKIFVCQNWSDNFIFSDNRSLSAQFREMPLDVNKVPRIFKTYILDTHGKKVAPLDDTSAVHEINFGMFMTGFHSGTGFYLLNSGDQKIISTLSLTGEHARSGIYKFKENSDSRFKIDGGNSAIFELGQKESGYFEVQFWTTGKSGARNSRFTDDLDTDGYFYYFSGHDGAGYSPPAGHDGYPRPSQLTVASTDQYNYDDPSGTLKIDLTGNAEAVDPKAISTFTADAVEGDIFITGGWTYPEYLTATGIVLEVSGTAYNAAAADPHGATGLLVDEATGTTSFSYAVIPGKTHHFRIRTQNIDLIGGNVHGGVKRTVNHSEWVHVSASVTDTALNVSVNPQNYAESPSDSTLKNVNLNTLATNELTRLQNSTNMPNTQLTVDVFSKIRFNFAPNMLVYSDDANTPAVDTGQKFTKTGLDPIPIEIYIPKTTQIIGAGGKGASVMSDRTYGSTTKKECPASYVVTSAQRSTLTSAEVRLGSLPELAGVGPISAHYLSGKMDGSYIVGTTPNNGQNGGTALSIHSDYAGSSVKLHCRGFIGGGGGGGGAGGTRVSNYTHLITPKFCLVREPDGSVREQIGGKDEKGNIRGGFLLPYQRTIKTSNFTAQGNSQRYPSLQNRLLTDLELPEDWKDENAKDHRPGNTVIFEIRPGGGGGGGAGYSLTDPITSVQDGQSSTIMQESQSAPGGDSCVPFVSNINVHGSRTLEVTEKSSRGSSFKIKFPINSGAMTSVNGGLPGQAAVAPIIVNGQDMRFVGSSSKIVQDPSGLIFAQPSLLEGYRNAGGIGGRGGGFGMDGNNGEHPVQNYTDRHIGLVDGAQYGPEPRNFGFGGTGGACIDANGALIDFYPKDNIPCSGQDNKTHQDNKNSELYRNRIGKGAYLTPKYKSATTIETSGHLSVGYISGLKGTRKADGSEGDTINFAGVDKKVNNQSNAVNGSYPAWKAFNQVINGNFDDYVLMDQDDFPYYLIYDFGAGNQQTVKSYTIGSAGASASYFNNGAASETRLKTILGNVFAPVHWKLFGSNANSDELLRDSDMILLHEFRHFSHQPAIQIAAEGSQVRDASFTDNPAKQLTQITVEGSKHNSYACVPGQVRLFTVPDLKRAAYRYYILKILGADGNQGKVKIADFGLRGSNESYAGFINLIQ
tara:strand:- start:1501 stop:5985 length:4485 start_codon:yes stop_codon:yes gene_type:complete